MGHYNLAVFGNVDPKEIDTKYKAAQFDDSPEPTVLDRYEHLSRGCCRSAFLIRDKRKPKSRLEIHDEYTNNPLRFESLLCRNIDMRKSLLSKIHKVYIDGVLIEQQPLPNNVTDEEYPQISDADWQVMLSGWWRRARLENLLVTLYDCSI